MPKIRYLDKFFSPERMAIVDISNGIIEDYQAQGFRLTLRQLYYRLVAGDHFPDNRKWSWTGTKWVRDPNGTKNAEPNYNWLGELVSDARLSGLIDWNAIEDRTRELGVNSHWNAPTDIIDSAAESYQNDLWRWQPVRPEVWVEKDALEGIVASACRPLDVPYFSCRGYTSLTAIWEAAQRMLAHRQNRVIYEGPHKRKNGQKFKQKIIVFHLGDHDPSGIDMTRDIRERLEMFMGEEVDLRRIALNMDQVEKYGPPPNPAKTTDSRFRAYLEQYGTESWELDALEPKVMVGLIQANLRRVMDKARFQEAVDAMEKGRKELKAISNEYQKAVQAVLGEEDE
jgi:hypothetical protein